MRGSLGFPLSKHVRSSSDSLAQASGAAPRESVGHAVAPPEGFETGKASTAPAYFC